ncbi:MAG: hypothetical protein L3J53_08175 [Proteobacteria bacterium]|nr:hypothetical protein [Pseudomonadota bacterium]
MKKTSSLINKKILYIIALSGFIAIAQAGVAGTPNYSIEKYVISSGGSISSGGGFTVQGSIGQVVTGLSNSASFSLQSGFWHEAVPLGEEIFKNSFE